MTTDELDSLGAAIANRLAALLQKQALPERGCFTLDQAAEFVVCHPEHIRREVKSGRLPAVDIGNGGRAAIRILRADLLSWLEQRKTSVFPVRTPQSERAKPVKSVKPVAPSYQSRHWKESPAAPSESRAA